MATTYYWVGGSGTWDNINSANWAATSGGAGGAGIPGYQDDATFDANSGTAATVTLASTAYTGNVYVTINKADIALTLTANVDFDYGSFFLTTGTLNLAGFSLSAGQFVSSNTNTRALAFGAGNITLKGGLPYPVDIANATSFTWTGTGKFIVTGTPNSQVQFGSTAGGSAANAPNIEIQTNFTVVITSGSHFKNIAFTGLFPSVTAAALSVYGNLILASGGTYTAVVPTFLASGTFTSNTKATGNVVINGTGITVTLGSALTLASTTTVTLTAGTLDLAGFTLSTGIFSSTNANTRAIAFGSGNIALTSTVAATTVLSMATATGFTLTGTGGFTRNQAATATVVFGTTGGTTANAPNLTVNAGASTLTITANSYFKNVNFTGSTCSVTATALNIAGNLTLASGGTYTLVLATFRNSGTLTTSSKPISALTVNGSGITVTLADALTTNGALTFTNGTLQLKSGATTTVGSFVTTGTTLKYLQSTISGVQATISDASGTNTATYLSIQDSNATGGAVWDATSATNVDAGNNAGWLGLAGITVISTGVFATGVIGNVTIYLLLVVSATGVQVIGAIGDVVVTGTAFVYPIGVVAYGLIGPVSVTGWGLIDTTQIPGWGTIINAQTPAWGLVPTPQTPNWQQIVS